MSFDGQFFSMGIVIEFTIPVFLLNKKANLQPKIARMKKNISIKKIAQLTGHNAAIYSLKAGMDEVSFFSGAGDGWVAQWDLNAPDMGRLVAKVDTQIFSICCLQDKKQIVVGNMNGGLHWVNVQDAEKSKNIAHHKNGVFDIRQIGDDVFSIGGEGMLTRWSAASARTLESFHLSNQALRCMDFCKSRNEIAVGSSDHSIYLLHAETLELKQRLPHAHDNSVFAIRYAPNGKYLLSGGRDAHLKIWTMDKNYECIFSQPAHWYTINDIAFHPKGHLFATASRDKTLKIWDAATFELLKVLEGIRDGGHLNSVNALYWSSYNNYLISCSDDRSMIVWEVSEASSS